MRSRLRTSPAAPHRCALGHYELGLVIAAPEARLVHQHEAANQKAANQKAANQKTAKQAVGQREAPDERLTRYGLVVRHYLHQLPHKVLDLEVLALTILPEAVRMVVRVRLPADHPAPPDPALLRDAVRWLKAMTTGAHLRGAARGRWQGTSSAVWTRGFARRLLRSPTEVARALSACRQSSA